MKSVQIIDQTAKGGILGLLGYFLLELGVDQGIVAALIPLLAAILAWLSGRVGDQAIASFLGAAPVRDAVKGVAKAAQREVRQAEKAAAEKSGIRATAKRKAKKSE